MTDTTTSSGNNPGVMRKQHNLTVRTSLPRYLPPQEVVNALQTYIPVIKHQALVTRYERAMGIPHCARDPFFHGGSPIANPAVDDNPPVSYRNGALVAFNVFERINLIPGIASKEITFPATFQNVPGGVRCRADAPGGVTLWTEFKVRPKPRNLNAPSSAAGSAWDWEAEVDRRREYELVEWVTVEASSLLMPFVARSMEGAHKDICQKVIDEVAVRWSWE
ncbi:hypothetical protein VUR80DRAFT_6944 [Thermomyces stellatus]